ncbi:peroxiredoxin [Conexibacter woesei]|uniref:Alkyl hydroperoxide reductase/ Thiol specific antioxidant/ Mal allergen n=1 Tax=Conexibacter woesei (strain DSM 14684 / CCUG 47730 / CIP 108061 / JCM 11494 / NBRC 100937 / ID131577) TaxID=469383 RepID=D3EZC3_CONWI|nr:peroxiredoxin [Conexibacter woesei]ADB51888.1 alkyl hydroperoxide reductase/ Thiol specific antioxidant/ Mal allergen [Conexibacter woesei DSM 14684]
MAAEQDFRRLPPDLPVPLDDGAADHLPGLELPALTLPSTKGEPVDLAAIAAEAATLVLYVYPRTGTPGEELPEGWDDVPGARGCTPQNIAFRDHRAQLTVLGADVVGLSAQSSEDQQAFSAREHIPFPLLSDPGLELAAALGLPTFEIAGMTLYRRITLIAREGVIARVFYPVFPPDRDAANVAAWLGAVS